MLILVDAMGGDNAPEAIVNGCMDAISEQDGFDILLIGDSEKIKKIINESGFKNKRLSVRHTQEVITGEDSPTRAIRSKKDSSMVVGFNLLKEKQGDVFVSAGNTGALMTGALLLLGRIKGIDRPALPAVLPTKKGKVLLIDAGMNAVCKPVNYMQFGVMGSIYMKELFNIEKPKVGLLNVGSEETKGNDLIKQAYTLLSQSDINFTGNIEGKDVMLGNTDVAVCDGFIGNIALKLLEGTALFFFGELRAIFTKNILTKLSYLGIKKPLKEFAKAMDDSENGGAPILGVNGLVIKSHGSSNAKTIKNVIIKRAFTLAKTSVLEQIRGKFKNMEVEEVENGN